MDTKLLSIAGFTIAMRFHRSTAPLYEKNFKDRLLYLYQGFSVAREKKQSIHYTIDFVERDNFETVIQKEGKKYFINCFEEKSKNHTVTFYHISIVQFEFLLRKILHTLLNVHDGMLLHASASIIDGKAYLFLGKSGAGKSTIAKLFIEQYPRVADDTVILKKEDGGFFVYRTPLKEKRPFAEKTYNRLPLGKVFFLRKASLHKVTKLQEKEYILQNFLEHGFFLEEFQMEKEMLWVLNFVNNWQEFYTLSFSLQNPESMIELVANTV